MFGGGRRLKRLIAFARLLLHLRRSKSAHPLGCRYPPIPINVNRLKELSRHTLCHRTRWRHTLRDEVLNHMAAHFGVVYKSRSVLVDRVENSFCTRRLRHSRTHIDQVLAAVISLTAKEGIAAAPSADGRDTFGRIAAAPSAVHNRENRAISEDEAAPASVSSDR